MILRILGIILICFFFIGTVGSSVARNPGGVAGSVILYLIPGALLLYFSSRSRKRRQSGAQGGLLPVLKHDDQKKAELPPLISASGATPSTEKEPAPAKSQQPDCIGVRFDIGKINSGGYGAECWKVFWSAVDVEIVAGSQLLEGDTNDTPDQENVYCLAVRWTAGSGRGDDLRRALEQSERYRAVASNPNFISSIQVSREPLVEAGRVDRSGHIVGTSYRALPALAEVQKARQHDQSRPSGESATNLQGFDVETDMRCERCGKAILSRGKFLNELNKHGLTFNQGTNSITVSGSFAGHSEVGRLQRFAQEIEQLSALKCNSCGKIYCLTCLFRDAPRHPTSGGKACFSCMGSISHAG